MNTLFSQSLVLLPYFNADIVACSNSKDDCCWLFSLTQRDYYCVSNYYQPFCLTVRIVNVNFSVEKFRVMRGTLQWTDKLPRSVESPRAQFSIAWRITFFGYIIFFMATNVWCKEKDSHKTRHFYPHLSSRTVCSPLFYCVNTKDM